MRSTDFSWLTSFLFSHGATLYLHSTFFPFMHILFWGYRPLAFWYIQCTAFLLTIFTFLAFRLIAIFQVNFSRFSLVYIILDVLFNVCPLHIKFSPFSHFIFILFDLLIGIFNFLSDNVWLDFWQPYSITRLFINTWKCPFDTNDFFLKLYIALLKFLNARVSGWKDQYLWILVLELPLLVAGDMN